MSIKSLDKVGYVSCKPVSVTDLNYNTYLVHDTMAFNPNSKTAPDTAFTWASGYGQKFFTPTSIEIDNKPFNIKIIGLEVRSQGGRAYKVIDDKNRRFDLREDQVFEIIRLCGIDKGGEVKIPVVWGILGSQVRLILVGGKLYNEMMGL